MIEEKNSNEISLGELLQKTRYFLKLLISKWIFILIASILGGSIGFIIALKTKPTYIGTLSFVLSSGSKEGGLSGLASQFGLDMGSSGNDVFSGDNILTLFKSQKLIKSVLFKKIPDANDFLANIMVKELQWDKKWNNLERTKNLFPFSSDTSKLNPIQDSLIREVYNYIIINNLNVLRKDKKLSVYEVSTKSTNELFSCYLTLFLMDETAKFYIDTKTSLAKLNLRMLQKESDSLRGLLGNAISVTARETDRTFALNPAMQFQRASGQKNQVGATVFATAYGEVVKNLELAKINLQKETPLYQIIDIPEIPLKKIGTSKRLYAVLGAGLFCIITILYFLFIKIKRSNVR